MCGIAGYLAFDAATVDPSCLLRMTSRLQHRGPDDAGHEAGSPQASEIPAQLRAFPSLVRVGLAHRRLSILDLSAGGHQPMLADEGRLRMTYNGEVYNFIELREELSGLGHTFRTASDSEVLLAAYREWGDACVARFNGIFALAIWDSVDRSLFLARDHLGVKPLHYTVFDGVFYFASETPALMAGVPRDWQIDATQFVSYLHCMYVPFPGSIVAGISKVPPATTVRVRADGTVTMREYWRVTRFGERAPADANEQFSALLDDAMRLQMRSDVPIATFLSGGIDSSAIVALLHRQGVVPIYTFAVGYEGSDVDERPFARLVAERAGADHHELLITASQLDADLDRALDHLPEPLADSALLPTFLLCEWARMFGVKVVLNGTGGDEVFGGYTRYQPSGLARRAFDASPGPLRAALARVAGGRTADLRARYRSADLIGSIAGNLDFLARHVVDAAALEAYCARLEANTGAAHRTPGPANPRYQKMHFDLKYYLVDDLLMLLDAMGMASAVEGRVPLLDYRFVEFLYSLPEDVHFRTGLKSFARAQLAGLLPPEVLNRRKMGFGAPVPYWMRATLPKIRRTLGEGALFRLGLVKDPYGLRALLDCPAHSTDDLWMIFRLYIFERWYQNVFLPARADGLRHHSYAQSS